MESWLVTRNLPPFVDLRVLARVPASIPRLDQFHGGLSDNKASNNQTSQRPSKP